MFDKNLIILTYMFVLNLYSASENHHQPIENLGTSVIFQFENSQTCDLFIQQSAQLPGRIFWSSPLNAIPYHLIFDFDQNLTNEQISLLIRQNITIECEYHIIRDN